MKKERKKERKEGKKGEKQADSSCGNWTFFPLYMFF